jgi:hypothetical protein
MWLLERKVNTVAWRLKKTKDGSIVIPIFRSSVASFVEGRSLSFQQAGKQMIARG